MDNVRTIPVIAFLGGIGSGKSAVANELARRQKAAVINADHVGHEVLRIPEIIQQITQNFGNGVLDDQQQIDRKILAASVFGPSEKQQSALRQLEQIVHPEIRKQIEQTILNLKQQNKVDLILLDAAVLLEAKWDHVCDEIIFVDVPEATRLKRVQENRGWTEDEFRKREASQLDLPAKKAHSTFCIQNDSTLEKAVDQLEIFLRKFHFLKPEKDSKKPVSEANQ